MSCVSPVQLDRGICSFVPRVYKIQSSAIWPSHKIWKDTCHASKDPRPKEEVKGSIHDVNHGDLIVFLKDLHKWRFMWWWHGDGVGLNYWYHLEIGINYWFLDQCYISKRQACAYLFINEIHWSPMQYWSVMLQNIYHSHPIDHLTMFEGEKGVLFVILMTDVCFPYFAQKRGPIQYKDTILLI